MLALPLLAISSASTWGIEDWFIFAVILAAVVGITYLALQYFGIAVPPIFLRIVGIVVVAAFAILAIRFLFTL